MDTLRFSTPVLREFSDFFDGFFDTPAFQRVLVPKSPRVNIQEKQNEFLLEMMAPGLNKSDFKINLDKNMLTISYEQKKSSEEKDKEGKIIRKEFEQSSFSRSFSLDDKIDTAGIKAVYENGVLKLTLPKKVNAVEEVKQIEIQ
jgi:HSP20 family protein